MKLINSILTVLICVLLAVGGFSAYAAPQLVSIENNAIVDLVQYNGHTGGTATSVNSAANALMLGEGVTVKLDASSATAQGVFTIYANIYAPNGGFTVDATGITTIRWIGGVECSDTITVKGATDIQFGDTVTTNAKNETNMAFFKADFAFENGPGAITFVNAVTFAKLPTCEYSIAEGTHVALAEANLMEGTDGVFNLTSFNVTLVDVAGINADKIVVNSGRYVTLFPCNKVLFGSDATVTYNAGRWAWGGSGGRTCAYDFDLRSGSELGVYGSQVDQTFSGKISGSGNLTLGMTAAKLPANINFSGTVNLSGLVTLLRFASIHCNGTGPFDFGDLDCLSYAGNGNTFTFKKAAEASIGTLTGGIKVVGDANSSFAVGGLAANAQLDVNGKVKMTIESAADTAVVNLLGNVGDWTIQGPEESSIALTLAPETEGLDVTIGGKLSLGELGSAFGTLNLLAGAELSGTTFNSVTLVTGLGKFVRAGSAWKNKVDFWADASAGDECFQTVWQFSPEVDHTKVPADRIVWWKDCRAEKRTGDDAYGLAMTRFAASGKDNIAKYPNMYPAIVPDGLNGNAYVKLSSGTQQTRLGLTKLNATIVDNFSAFEQKTPQYAIVVTRNCVQNQGSAVLSSVKGALAASKMGYDAVIFTNELVSVRRNGEQVDRATTTWGNSVWGIYSFTTANAIVNGIAAFDNPANSQQCGGFDYAEIMLFSAAPTESECKFIEKYLADKWGLTCAHEGHVDEESLALSPAGGAIPGTEALVTYANSDMPRNITINVNVPSDFKRGVRYPLVKYSATDTVTLGNLSGKTVEGLELVQENGVAYLMAPARGFILLCR